MISISMAGSRWVQLQPWYELWAGVTCCVAGELGAEGEGDSIPVITVRMGVLVDLLSYEII